MRRNTAWAFAACSAIAGIAWDLSGFQNIYIAALLWGLSAGFGMAGLLNTPTLYPVHQIRSSKHVYSLSMLFGAVISMAFSATFWPSASEQQLAREQSEKNHIGRLLPAGDTVPPGPQDCFGPHQIENSFMIMLGDRLAALARGQLWVIASSRGDVFRAEIVDGELFITASIYSKSGQILAQIERNEWRIANHAPWYDRPDASTLEVYDHRGNSVLYVRFVSKRVIKIRGQFKAYGRTIVVDDKGLYIVGGDWMWSDWCILSRKGLITIRDDGVIEVKDQLWRPLL